MAGYKATQLRKPEDEVEFEKNIGVLFRILLNDQNVQRLGRRGQAQYGIDLVAKRNGKPRHAVGIQCKLKGEGKELTESEVRKEVRKALKYRPLLKEYFVVTTAPNDAKLTTLALTLSNQQAAKGREILIEVWGWNTLEERINEHEEAKQAFDPGFSPSLQRHGEQLDAVLMGQRALATSAQVAELAARFEDKASANVTKLPTFFADREIREVLSRTLRRRSFGEAKTAEELAELAGRVINGDLSLGSQDIKLDVLQRAARVHVEPKTLDKAEHYFAEARKLDPQIDARLFDALVADAKGNDDFALRALRQLDSPDARSAIFNILARVKGTKPALDWLKSSGRQITDFNPVGVVNILLKLAEDGKYQEALTIAAALPSQLFDHAPALYFVRANIKLAAALPADQKVQIFSGLPLNPRALKLASDRLSRLQIKSAISDIQRLAPVAEHLGLTRNKEYLDELQLWIQLEDPDSREQAIKTVAVELAEPAKTLRRVRLALSYQIPFNREALIRHLQSQRAVGGWTDDERFAAFLLAFSSGSPAALATFFDQYRDELFEQKVLPGEALAAIEVEILGRAGRFDEARKRLNEAGRGHFK